MQDHQIHQLTAPGDQAFIPNLNALSPVLDLIMTIVRRTNGLVEGFLEGRVENKKYLIREVYTESASLYFLDYIIWCSLFSDPDHIFYKPESHTDWQRLNANYETILISSEEQILRNTIRVSKYLDTGVAAAGRSTNFKNKVGSFLVHQCLQVYYLCSPEKRQKQNKFIKANPSIETALKVWNQLEKTEARPLMVTILPSINVSHILHIPKLLEPITLENV